MDDLFLCCLSPDSSQEDSLSLLQRLALKGQQLEKKNFFFQFAQIQVWYLGHLMLEKELNLDFMVP